MAQRLVLVVDDNPDARLIFKLILEARGFAVLQAVNGEEGVELAAAHRPDIVFMDLMMPVLDGWGAIARLRATLDDDGRMPVVAVTAYDPPRGDLRRAGFCGVLVKPFTVSAVARCVSFCLEARERGESWIPDLHRQVASA